MYQQKPKTSRYVLIALLLTLFYFMFFHSDRKEGVDEVEFNRTVLYKGVESIYSRFGEPDGFQTRGELLVLDYNDLVRIAGEEERDIRYSNVRLLYRNIKKAPLSPKAIYFVK